MELVEAHRLMKEAAGQMTPLPAYRSHKTVWALKIKEILREPVPASILTDADHGIIVPELPQFAPIRVDAEYMDRHKPQAGGYFVQYAGGYKSYSPARPFEEGYTLHDGNDLARDIAGIGWAIKQMHNGNKVCRTGWNGKGMHLALQVPDDHSKMTLPYIYMFTAQGDLVPWLASQTDLLATDWEIVTV